MKIVHISIYPPKGETHSTAGGVASYTKNLITKISYDQTDEVFILCNKVGEREEQYIEDNIKVIRCFDKKPKFIFQLLREIKKINPDVIHVQQELALFGGVLTAYLLQWLLFCLKKYKLIITLHGVVSLEKINRDFIKENNSNFPVWLTKFAFRIIYKPLCIWTKNVIVHENYFKKILVDEYGVDTEKISVVFHGVEEFVPINKMDACEKLGFDANKDIILYMGYLTGYKGIDLLIESYTAYVKMNKNAFLIIGAGKHPKLKNDEEYLKEYNRLVNKAKKMIPKNQYKWIGFIEENDITKYYSAANVSIYPYTIQMSSSGPMAIAIGHNKPFFASDAFNNVLAEELIFGENRLSLEETLNIFFNDQKIFKYIAGKMKNERLWSEVGAQTYKKYLNL